MKLWQLSARYINGKECPFTQLSKMPPVEGQWQSDPLLSSQSAFLKTRRKPQTLSFAISPSQQALHKELPRLACNDLRSEANLLVALYYNLLLLAPCH